jgi:DNA repair exonuclease SbcCD nuclease subunit
VEFLKRLGRLVPTYLIIGNHDLMNETQFLSTNHFFTVFHGVESVTNVTIIDTPQVVTIGYQKFVMCPYVPKGRFREALDTLGTINWKRIDAVFAHQEFEGAQQGAKVSDGDPWPPHSLNVVGAPVISGHIHEAQTLPGGVYYTGSAMQHTFAEGTRKGVWEIKFVRGVGGRLPFTHTVIETNLKTKITKKITAEEAIAMSERELSLGSPGVEPTCRLPPEGVEVKICIIDSHLVLESLQKSKVVERLESLGLVVVLTPKEKNKIDPVYMQKEGTLVQCTNFWELLQELINTESEEQNDPQLIEVAKEYLVQ